MSNLEKIISSLEKPKTFSQLKKDTGLENGVLQHHINNSDRIKKEKDAIMLKYQCQNCELSDACGDKCIHSTLQDSRKNKITTLLDQGLLQSEIAEELDISRPTVNHHVNSLREANILDEDSIEESVKKLL